MATIPEVAEAMQTILSTVAETAAHTSGFVQRKSKLGGSIFCRALVLGWLERPDARLDELAQMAHTLGVAVTGSGIDQRFTAAAATYLEQVLLAAVGVTIRAEGALIPLLERFPGGVWVQDSSTISLPPILHRLWEGGGKAAGTEPVAAIKMHLRFDLAHGTMEGPHLTPGRRHDKDSSLQHTSLPSGALRLADLGYFCLQVFRALGEAGCFWLSRWLVQVVLFDGDGKRWDVVALLEHDGTRVVDRAVLVGAKERLPCRLLAVRVPEQVANARRRQLHAQAKRKGQMVSQARLRAAAWEIMLTNVPPEDLSVQEAVVLLRARWQVELLFKLWKQDGVVDEWRSAKQWRILCEVYAKLIGLVIQHWLLLLGCWQLPDRSVFKAARTVRHHILVLAQAFPSHLEEALSKLQPAFTVGCRLNKRKKRPATYQLLQAPSLPEDWMAA